MPTRKYHWTRRQDALLLRHYNGHPARLRMLYRRLPYPPHAIKQRARRLGLTRIKEPRWTEAEERYLTTHLPTMPWPELARRLRRTVTALKLHTKRMGLRKTTVGLTVHSAAKLLGCDDHKIARWIRCGWLPAQRRGTDRRAAQGGDSYLVWPTALRRFIILHPEAIDLRHVDPLWFIDLLIGRFESAGGPVSELAPSDGQLERLDRVLHAVTA